MDAVMFLKELNRLTDGCAIECVKCPFDTINNGKRMNCEAFRLVHPERAVEIVEKWSRENPVKTMVSDFFEKFPNAPKNEKGFPDECCPYMLGLDEGCPYNSFTDEKCFACWSRPLEESK